MDKRDANFLQPIKEFIKDDVRTVVIGAIKNLRLFISETPYLEEYIRQYFLGGDNVRHQLFDIDGNPKISNSREIETFLLYQRNKIKRDRALTFLGIGDDPQYPSLSQPRNVVDAIDYAANARVNRYWRLVTKSGALR